VSAISAILTREWQLVILLSAWRSVYRQNGDG
jgi:hypothetical protein